MIPWKTVHLTLVILLTGLSTIVLAQSLLIPVHVMPRQSQPDGAQLEDSLEDSLEDTVDP